nr:30S ribosomal protein S18 [Candidatus Tremblaya phenacola]
MPLKKKANITWSKANPIDYKDISSLRTFVTSFGKVMSSRITGTETRIQKQLSIAIKRARFLSLLPYASMHLIYKEPNRTQ